MPTTYKDAGLDLDVYRESMSRLPRLMRRTFSPRVLELEGGFAGLFQLDFDSRLFRRNYRDPVLIACTDGVGTKLKVAQMTGVHHTIGIDLVAMCVNDALCCGAEPLFFLDYVAMAKDDPAVLEEIVAGVSEGCMQADCALLGGETAIMPDVYRPDEYDLAGFCVGVAERRQLIDGKTIAPGDVVLGVASNGLHSNGYSLVRKVVFEKAGLTADRYVEELGQTVGEALLAPTYIYAKPLRKILQAYRERRILHGVAHITGGGLRENLGRILPPQVRVELKPNSWTIPPVFPWLQRLGDIADEEMEHVFNCGVGLVLVFNPHFQRNIQEILSEHGLESWLLGQVVEGPGDVVWA